MREQRIGYRKVGVIILATLMLLSTIPFLVEAELVNYNIISTPSSADVFIDDMYKGETPTQISGISEGNHTVRLSIADYQDWVKTDYLGPNQTITYNATLVLKPTGSYTIRSSSVSGGVIPASLTITDSDDMTLGYSNPIFSSAFNSTRFVVGYGDGNTSLVYVRVGDNIDGTLTWVTDEVEVTGDEFGGTISSIATLDSTHFIVVYELCNPVTYVVGLRIGDISTGSLVMSSVYETELEGAYLMDIGAFNSNYFVMSYRQGYGTGTNRYMNTRIGYYDGESITFGTEYPNNILRSDNIRLDILDSTHFVHIYSEAYYSKVRVGERVGTDIVFGNWATYYTNGYILDTGRADITTINSTNFAIAYWNETSENGELRIGTVDGSNNILFNEPIQTFSVFNSDYIELDMLDGTYYVLNFAEDNWIKTVKIGNINTGYIECTEEPLGTSGVNSMENSLCCLSTTTFVATIGFTESPDTYLFEYTPQSREVTFITIDNAAVFLDSVYVGYTPLEISNVPIGVHTISVETEDYDQWTKTEELTENQHITYDAQLIKTIEIFAPDCANEETWFSALIFCHGGPTANVNVYGTWDENQVYTTDIDGTVDVLTPNVEATTLYTVVAQYSDGSMTFHDLTVVDVFSNQLPYAASSPSPADETMNVSLSTVLTWSGGDPDPNDTVTYDVFIGTIFPLTLVASDLTSSSYDASENLNYNIYYTWQVRTKDNHRGSTLSESWNFKTEVKPNDPPMVPNSPLPSDGANEIPLDQDLQWSGGDPDLDVVTYDIYFGAGSTPVKISGGLTSTFYDPGSLLYDTLYSWKIIAFDAYGASSEGPLWSFTTEEPPNNPPNIPSNPNPSNGATGIPIRSSSLSWTGGDPDSRDTVTYDVFFGTTNPPPKISSNQTNAMYDPGTLEKSTVYYWRIIAWDNHHAEASSPIWSFVTKNTAPTTSKPSGPTMGKRGVNYTYTMKATDKNLDQVFLKIDWGNGVTDWLGPYNQGTSIPFSHSWATAGMYIIRVKAMDIHGAVSTWSSGLTVRIR